MKMIRRLLPRLLGGKVLDLDRPPRVALGSEAEEVLVRYPAFLFHRRHLLALLLPVSVIQLLVRPRVLLVLLHGVDILDAGETRLAGAATPALPLLGG